MATNRYDRCVSGFGDADHVGICGKRWRSYRPWGSKEKASIGSIEAFRVAAELLVLAREMFCVERTAT